MVRIGLKELVTFMGASDATKQRILRTRKYEVSGRFIPATYYREAKDAIRMFHKHHYPRKYLRDRAADLALRSQQSEDGNASRIAYNAHAMLQYEKFFGDKQYDELLPTVRLRLQCGPVMVSVSPELHVMEKRHEKLIKFDFSKDELSDEEAKIVTRVMVSAAAEQMPELAPSDIQYMDVIRGRLYKGSRVGTRLKDEIEATCEYITAIWDRI